MSKRKLWPKICDFFSLILKDPNRKSICLILKEYSFFLLTNTSIAEQYFSKFLYRKGVTNFEDYVLTHTIQNHCWGLNDMNYTSILDNKYLFEEFMANHNLKVIRSVAYNINSLFFFDHKMIQINTTEEFLDLFMQISEKTRFSKNIFIKKTQGSGGGKNIYKTTYAELFSDQEQLEFVFSKVIESGYIFQEEIIQHEEINKLNPYCVNTLRIDTFTNRNNKSQVTSANMRIGLNKAYVDNTSSGGAYVGIDFKAGMLRAEALSDFTHGKGMTYREHPENKLRFEGFVIPFFSETMELVTKAASTIPQIRIIGWDVAITPDGPILLEGNELPSMMFGEIGQKGFRRNPAFMEMYTEVTGTNQNSFKSSLLRLSSYFPLSLHH